MVHHIWDKPKKHEDNLMMGYLILNVVVSRFKENERNQICFKYGYQEEYVCVAQNMRYIALFLLRKILHLYILLV